MELELTPRSYGLGLKQERYGIIWPGYGLCWQDGGGDEPPPDLPPGDSPPGDPGKAEGDETPVSWQEQFLAGDEFKELRENPTLKTIKDIPTLAKSMVETKAKVGKKGEIPGKDAPPEEVEAFYQLLGKPKTAEEYQIERPEMPEGLPYMEELEKDFLSTAFRANLSGSQTADIYNWFIDYQIDLHNHNENIKVTAHNQSVEAFKKELGDNYEAELKAAELAAYRFGGQELRDYLDSSRLGSHPAMVKAWMAVAKSIGEGEFVAGGPAQAKGLDEQLAAINKHPAMLDTQWVPGKGEVPPGLPNFQNRKEVLAYRDKLFVERHPETDVTQ
jgi:hypothetical protein